MNTQLNPNHDPSNIIELPKQPSVDKSLTSQVANLPIGSGHCKISVGQWKVHGQLKWYVRYPENGKPRRKTCDDKAQADAFAAEQRGHGMTNKQRLLLLPPGDQNLLLAIYDDAQKRGIALPRVLGSVAGLPLDKKVVPGVGAVIAALVAEKEDHNKDEDYVDNLEQSWNKFAKGRELMPVDAFTTQDIKDYMKGKSAGYQKTLRPKISMLFIYALREGHILRNPCDGLPDISYKKGPVQVFTVDEAKECLKWLVKNPKGLAWFIKTSFAGLRPQDEACLTGWESIDFKRKCIVVDETVCKTGKRRVVYPPDMVFDWLRWAKDHGSELPLTISEVVTIQRKLRAVLGWKEWKQDVTRHSAATYWLASTNDAKKVSRSLGHSLTILDQKYDARKFEHEGVDYYALTVDKFI